MDGAAPQPEPRVGRLRAELPRAEPGVSSPVPPVQLEGSRGVSSVPEEEPPRGSPEGTAPAGRSRV